MQEKVKDAPSSEFKWVGTRPDPSRRRRQGDRPRQVRRRPRHAGPAGGPGAAQPAPACPHQVASTYRRPRKLPGVKAMVTRDDFKDQPSEFIPAGEMMINYRDVVRNVMAREKVLYEGHAVAAVAATSAAIAKQALKLIKVDYEVLPHVIDVVEAMQPGAPLLHEDTDHGRRRAGAEEALQRRQAHRVRPSATSRPASRRPTSSSSARSRPRRCTRATSSRTPASPACRRTARPMSGCRPRATGSCARHCARLLGWDVGQIRVTASEIGGGFGGKTVVYLEPVALALVQEGAPAGEDGDDARGGVPRLRPDLGRARARQDRRQEGRRASSPPRRS